MKVIQQLLLTCAAAAALHLAPTVHGQALPPVNLGATSFMDGAPPDGPGFYLSQYLQYRESRHFKGANGQDAPLPGPRFQATTLLVQGVYLWDYEIPGLKAKPALDVLLPFVMFDLDYSAPGPFPNASGGGVGDLVIGPALQFNPIMGEKGPLFMHRLETQFILPTGDYSPSANITPGSGFFSFNPYWAGTLFLGPRVATSFRAHYLWNARNDRPNRTTLPAGTTSSQAGQAFHVNFTLDAQVVGPLRAGLNGYWLKQFTDSEVNGAKAGRREQVLGIGPGAMFSFNAKHHLFANVYFETEARNRFAGTVGTFRYVMKF